MYVYGLDRISQSRSYFFNNQSLSQTSYYVYDGHGSTRALTDPNGAVTDTYDYDAFGNLIHSTATGIPPGGTSVVPTPNEFLFAGEQFDSDLGLYYNRARYLNVSTGRFWTMDTYDGDPESPLSLHKYLYVSASPVNGRDPSGNFEFEEFMASIGAQFTVYAMEYPTLFQALSVVVGALAPLEIQAIDPTFDFEAVTGLNVVLEQARQLGLIQKAFSRIGGFAKLGSGFEEFIAKIARKAEGYLGEQVRILDGQEIKESLEGSARIDFLFRQFILEVKLTAAAALNNANQIIQYAKFGKETGLPIRYIFLQKPSAQEMQAIKQIVSKESPSVGVIFDYLFD